MLVVPEVDQEIQGSEGGMPFDAVVQLNGPCLPHTPTPSLHTNHPAFSLFLSLNLSLSLSVRHHTMHYSSGKTMTEP